MARVIAPGIAALLFLALGGPVAAQPLPLEDRAVAGWPRLRIDVHYVSRLAMRGACFPLPAGQPIPDTTLNSCARPDFWSGVCSIYIDVRHVENDAILDYERKRCRGHDRRGGREFADAWRAWRLHGENRYANMVDFQTLMLVIEPVGACRDGNQTCIDVIEAR